MVNLPALYLMSTLHLLQTDSHAEMLGFFLILISPINALMSYLWITRKDELESS